MDQQDEGHHNPAERTTFHADQLGEALAIDQEDARRKREAELLRVAGELDPTRPIDTWVDASQSLGGLTYPEGAKELPPALDGERKHAPRRLGELKFHSAVPPLAVKDSGTRREFSTGSVRDAATGKGRYDLLPPVALCIVAQLYEKGARKYDARNWEKGQPLCEGFLDSAKRHLEKHHAGWRDEDHLAAAAWNVLGMIHTEHQIARGKLPRELLDYPDAYVTEADVGGPVYEGEPCYKPEVPE